MYLSKIVLLFSLALLVSCEKSTPPVSTETVESLAANPERLKELRQQCKTNRAQLGDELCNRVAEATNKRFFGDDKVPYTPSKDSPKF
ncbi:EexN family lipoprotein [Burkholderia pseudomallei]|uniref:EexN family lipoprotein n=1 Tax=Burkholderia pseudomallei TaxID=28450 RepID=UPI0005103E30|nr:putative lipoprotein [Burkholderia pseudomallei]KIX58935.1 lipoprotein [Burkholderia pseudomallei]